MSRSSPPPVDAALRRWASAVRGTVILPGDPPYDDARRVWNRAIDRRPAAIVQVADVDDVIRCIEVARARDLPLAVRSGGHSQAGWGVSAGGLVIDLGSLRAIEVDSSAERVRVAAGARAGEVVDATQARGFMTPMGGCPDVGVGGLTLGGGENFLMARYGAVVDNVTAMEVVTLDGDRVIASADENQDLFWALRGGGGNFGIVTAIEYRLHRAHDVLSGQFLFPLERARPTFERYRALMVDVPDDVTTSGGLTFMDSGPEIFVAVCFSGRREEAERALARWRAVLRPRDDNVKWAPFSGDLVEPPKASVGTGLFLAELCDRAIDAYVDAVAHPPRGATAVWNDFHGAVTRVATEAMAFPMRQRGFDLFVNVPWTSEAERVRATRWMRDLAGALRPLGSGVYVNNLDEGEGHRVKESFGANYERLARIKATYDPDNVLRLNPNVTPAPASGT